MVTMASKWRGKCRVCGITIPPGTQIKWTKSGGATHLSEEDCAAARLSPPVFTLRGPGQETPEDRERLVRLLLSHPWRPARTMPEIPHEYTLRRLWSNDADFVWCVERIRSIGYEQKFGGRVFVYYDIAEYQYWPCDGETRGPLEARTTVSLINRAVRKPSKRSPTLVFE